MRFNGLSRQIICLSILSLIVVQSQAQSLKFSWVPREDLNILIPPSVRIYETNGLLSDQQKIRAMYAVIDLRDKNLRLRAIGSNTRRETTLETYQRHRAIFAVNGGYFGANRSESLLVSDGELIAPGPTNFTRGAFGLVNRKPQIVWPYTIDSTSTIFALKDPLMKGANFNTSNHMPWYPALAVGGGPVLIKNGKIRDTSSEEGFGASHLARHPRTAIGYRDEHTLVVMVVDGRQHSSAGVTIKELAQIMFEAGCYEAVNLDGGGSSAMIAGNEVVNVPTDISGGNIHSLRKNASALVLTEEIPSTKKEVIVIDTDSKTYVEQGIWKNTNHVNFYGTSASREAQANQANKAVFRFSVSKRDSFQVAAWWTPHEKNSDQVRYILHHGNEIDTVRVDQSSFASNGRWNVLGKFLLSSQDFLEVLSEDEKAKIVTDAVRLVSLGDIAHQPERGDLRVAVISDLNSGLGSASYEWQVDSIVKRIPGTWRPDLVLCGGDMVAGMGISDTATLTNMWRAFDERIAEPLRRHSIPFAFTIGNHDGLRSYPAERNAIARYWNDPAHSTGLTFVDKSQFPHYYSFRAGEAFFVSWDASSAEITNDNLAWLADQFEKPESKNARFRFVVGHLPIYSVAQERDSKGNVLENGDSLRKILEKHQVKVYVSGHQHAYFPGKRGTLGLLNAGAAGSGPRRWLSTDKPPVNTVTIMDIFYEKDTIIYTTYDIKHRESRDMKVFDHTALPSIINGVNGFVIRNDIKISHEAAGKFSSLVKSASSAASGFCEMLISGNSVSVSGNFVLGNKLLKSNDAITLHSGKNTQVGELVYRLSAKSKNRRSGTFAETFRVDEDFKERLSAGGYYVVIRSERFPDGELRAQLYPKHNVAPEKTEITSHDSRHTYGIRNSNGLYRFTWNASHDADGDPVSYSYQMSSDSLFYKIIFEENTGRTTSVKTPEQKLSELVGTMREGQALKRYHRVIATDGMHATSTEPAVIRFMKSSEPLLDFIEVDPAPYTFAGKIEEASGQGSGAVWDKFEKLWLADYAGTLFIKTAEGKNASFSPLREVMVNNKSYALKPVNGISADQDGNILVACNRFLFKIDAVTGKGIAVWEAPQGKRAITTPRINEKGEIYAMSLFGEDPNYVLKESATEKGTFDLVRTINLPQRILARTFDMSNDGLKLFFPDPGSPFIQTYTSDDGIVYKRGEDINSIAAGCNAISVLSGTTIFCAVRASGVTGSTLHVRDEQSKMMWTLPLPELDGAEARGIAVSPDGKTIVICAWDKGGGFWLYRKK